MDCFVCLWMRGFRKETRDLINLKQLFKEFSCDLVGLSQEAFSLAILLIILCSCLISSLCVFVSF